MIRISSKSRFSKDKPKAFTNSIFGYNWLFFLFLIYQLIYQRVAQCWSYFAMSSPHTHTSTHQDNQSKPTCLIELKRDLFCRVFHTIISDLAQKVGQLGIKLDKYGTFDYNFSVHFGVVSQND